MPRAKWTTKPTEIKVTVAADGTHRVEIPVYDNGVKAFTEVRTITPDRVYRLEVRNEPGAAGLSGFEAWSTS